MLLTAQPGWGHVQPVLAIARQLQDRGHPVLLATGRRYVAAAERLGVAAVAAGIDWDLSRPQEAFAHLGGLDALERTLALRDIFLGPAVAPMLNDLEAISRTFRPDVVVSEMWELAGAVVAEARGAASTTLSVVTVALPPAFATEESVAPYLAARALAGLPEIDFREWAARQRTLFGVPPSWFIPGLEPGPNVTVIRPPVLTEAGGGSLPRWLERSGTRPLVLATLGTVFWDNPKVLARIIEAAEGEDYDLLVALGHEVEPAAVGSVPPNVRVESYVPFAKVLPRCSAVITHGGFGTVGATLMAGLPMVVLPLGADQFVTATQVERLGIGVVVTGADPINIDLGVVAGSFVNPNTLTSGEVRAAIHRVLTDDDIRDAAASQRGEVEAIPADAAVNAIEAAAAPAVAAL